MAKQPGFLKRGESLRLQAFLSRSGLASRRAAEEMIEHGRVKVNGAEVTAQGTRVVAGVDRVELDGVEVKVAPTTWLALHKPTGYVTTRQDPFGRRTVYELIPDKFHGLFHVGRLDRDSEGLLLLTNDGDLANRFLHPSFGITKEYDVIASGKPSDAALRQLVEGVELEDGVAQAESARLIGPAGNGQSRLKLVLREGKKREVRRMLEAVGHPVLRLVRRRFGPIDLGELPEGKWRIVQPEELVQVRDAQASPKGAKRTPAAEAEAPKAKRVRAEAEDRPARGKAERPGRKDAPRTARGKPEREEKPARGAPRGRSFDRDEAPPAPRERTPVTIDWDAEEWGDAKPRGGDARPKRTSSTSSRGADERPAARGKTAAGRGFSDRSAEDRPAARGPRTGAGRGASDRPYLPSDRDRPAGRGGSDREDRPRRDFQDRDDRPARSGADRPARSGTDRPARGPADRPGRGPADRPRRDFQDRDDRPARAGSDRPSRPADRPKKGPVDWGTRAPRQDRDQPASRGPRPGPGRRPVDDDDDFVTERRPRSAPPPRGGAGPQRGGAPRTDDRPAGARPGGRPGGAKPKGGKPGGRAKPGNKPGAKPPEPGRRPGQGGGKKGR
ncbi:pseudouridine synthase [Longimicrobium sp.]|jgi:23S rRNA pseudouridine2605 synthase|uniref:pseudouridine synthase n=1 Tax=Longimicrobium sp. TaxID=2029185 RepID=UPI002F921A8C